MITILKGNYLAFVWVLNRNKKTDFVKEQSGSNGKVNRIQ